MRPARRAAIVVILALGRVAWADDGEDRIALVQGDREWERAVRGALAPAGFRVVAVDGTEAIDVDPVATGRATCARAGATAAVWLVAGDDGTSRILVYDLGVDRVLARALSSSPPLSAAQAAEGARMVRTMLRALRVTPDIDAAPPTAAEAPSVRARAAAIERGDVDPTLVVAAGPGVRIGSGAGWSMFGTVGWYRGWLGAAVSLSAGPSSDVDADAERARFADDSLAATMRARVRRGRIDLEAGAGAALHRTVFTGERASDGGALESTRYDPAFRLETLVAVRLVPGVSLAAVATGDALFRRARYLDGDRELLVVAPFHVGVSILFRAAIR